MSCVLGAQLFEAVPRTDESSMSSIDILQTIALHALLVEGLRCLQGTHELLSATLSMPFIDIPPTIALERTAHRAADPFGQGS